MHAVVGDLVGIESDQLVFDYLSRIGDLAHGTSMTAAERARLVTGLRGEIDRLRAEEGGAQSKAAVRKILARLGKPEEIVAGAGKGVPAPRVEPGPNRFGDTPFGENRDDRFGEEKKVSLWKRASPGRTSGTAPSGPPPVSAATGASAPHLAGMDELGPEESDPDWWRVDTSPYGDGGGGRRFDEPVPGFVGGIELPEMFKPPQEEGRPGEAGVKVPAPRPGEAGKDVADGEGVEAVADAPGGRRLLRPARLLRLRPGSGAGGPRTGGVVELAAAALLLAGALIGSLIPLGLGWLAAWWAPKLSRTEAKWAAMGMPGVVAGGAIVWLWGRMEDRWGDRIAEGGEGLGQALSDTGPVVLRVAAIASALYLVWRARRPKG